MRTLLCIVLVVGWPAVVCGQPREVKPAIHQVRKDVPPGKRPYEMVWAARTEKRVPLLPFEDLKGWTVEMVGHAVATLELSREQKVWGEHSAKLTYRGKPGENRIVLRPPKPLPIPGKFTAANLWCFGNNWGWVPRAHTPQVELALYLLDSNGKNYRVSLDRVRWQEWWFIHRRVINHLGSKPQFPFSLAGIEVQGGHQPEDRVLFLDSLSFYEEEWPQLTFQPRPRRNLVAFPGQDLGLNKGPGKLPFPTREETILPSNFAQDYETQVLEKEGGQFTFRYQGPDGELRYELKPQASGLGDLRVLVDNRNAARPLARAGVRFGNRPAGHSKLDAVSLEGDVLKVRQIQTVGDISVSVELRYRIWQKSLVVDVYCRGGQATELDLGAFDGVVKPEAIPLPYANYGGQSHCLLAWVEEKPFFASVWVDWYRSNGSQLFTRREVKKNSALINGGVRYLPKTDGQRNDLYERVFLTVSPLFEETLPTIANPASRWGAAAAGHLWQESWGPGDFEKEHKRSRRLRAHGIEKLIQCNHEIAWRDNADSFTLRIHAAPKKGGDEALKKYVARQRSLGWKSGLYTNYTDFAPVNENWDENAVQLEPNREWRRAWPRCYALKPSRAVEFDARYAPMIKKKYNPNSAYTDVHTAVAPWHYCDYDARVPGAGTFAATFYAYGELLLHDSNVYGGPIFSEGTYQCLYAGLPDGNYALHYGGYDFARDPVLPHFDLYKIHPLSTDIGMGWTANFCKWPEWNRPENLSQSIDRFLVTTMAYGHLGWLVEEGHGMGLTCRSYYVLQQLTQRYALVPPSNIQYFDGQKLCSSSEALATGAYRESQLHIVYQNGLELWLNASWEKSWQLPPSAGGYLLPPTGWCARAPEGDFQQVSALYEGRRYDFVLSPDYIYLDGRGKLRVLDCAAATGSVAIRAPAPDRLEVLDFGQNREIGFGGTSRRLVAAVASTRPTHADAYDVEGKHLGTTEIRWAHGLCWLLPRERGLRYVVEKGAADPEAPSLTLSCDSQQVFRGESVSVSVRSESPLSLKRLRASWRGKELSLKADPRCASFQVPAEAKPGETLWIRFEEATSGWLMLSLVKMADVKFAPQTVVLKGGRGVARLQGRLGLPRKPVTLTFECPPWLSVEPQQLKASGALDHEIVLRASQATAGKLKATATTSELREDLVFDLVPGETLLETVRLYDGSVKFSWGYCFRGQEEKAGDTSTGAIFHLQKAIGCGGVKRPGFFSHPPYTGGVGYSYAEFEPVQLPDDPCELRFYIGIKDGGHVSDGVDFIVQALLPNAAPVEMLRENTAKRAWREVRVDLERFRGQKVRFRFLADVGPQNNSTSDWASWGEPTVRLKSPLPTVTIR